MKTGSGKSSQDTWHCVVIGFDTGWVHFIAEDGQLLIAKQFVKDNPVLKIRVLPAIPPKRAKFPALLVPKLSELLLVYPKTIVSIDSSILMSCLVSNRAEAAQARAKGTPFNSLSHLPGRKWKIREQEKVNDVAAFAELNISFNQLHKVSMNKQLLNEDHLRSLGYVVSYLSVGAEPFLQQNSPHPLLPTNVTELAQNVVSTVKSGLLKAATGLFWGSSSNANPAQAEEDNRPKDPEQNLEIRFTFKDPLKEALVTEVSPDARYTAIYDVQNRVLLMENSSGIIIHVWKGYHHATFGWIHTMKDKNVAFDPAGSVIEFAILLAIYLPRRGLLEIWSPDQKSRVAHFPVSKRGKLLSCFNSVLDSKQSSYPRTFSTAFLNPDGRIAQIFVPIHALTDKSSAHDSNLHAKLKALLEEEGAVETDSLIELIKSSKSALSKLQMMKEILRNEGNVQPDQCRTVVEFLLSQVETSQFAKKHCLVMSNALKLFDYLQTETSDEIIQADDYTDLEQIQKVFQCSTFDGENFSSVASQARDFAKNGANNPPFSMSTFMSCFHFLQDNDDFNENLPLRCKNIDLSILGFLQKLTLASKRNFDETLAVCLETGLKSQDILLSFLRNYVEYGLGTIGSVSSIFALLKLCFDLHHKADEEMGNFQILLQMARNFLMKSDMTVNLYFAVFTWKSFLNQSESMTSYAEDWRQVLHFIQSFVSIKEKAVKYVPSQDTFTYKDIFASGNGKLVEVVASWLVDHNVKTDSLSYDGDFFKAASMHFPCSFHKDIIAAHLSWEYGHRWSKEKSRLELLQDSFDCLNDIESRPVQHRLTRLFWNVTLNKAVKDAVNLTEIRSATRCERELGFSEDALPLFFEIVCKFWALHEKTLNATEDIRLCYDVSCNDVGAQRQLFDVLSRMNLDIRDNLFPLVHQMTIVSCLIWHFGIEAKPLSLFSNQEVSAFFQTGLTPGGQESKTSVSLSAWGSMAQNRGVKNARKRFLELASEGAVAFLHPMADGGLDKSLYDHWADLTGYLAMYWNMQDKHTDLIITALYKAGHDSLGEEMMSVLNDKESISRSLLRVAMLRLAKELSLTERKIHTTPDVELAVKSFQQEIDEVIRVDLNQTANLLVALSNNDLADAEQQTVYEWLAVAQTLLRNQL